MNWQALWNGVKEPLRLFVLALVSWLIVELTKVDAQWGVVLVFVLRFVDSWLHELGKAADNKALTLGLTRF